MDGPPTSENVSKQSSGERRIVWTEGFESPQRVIGKSGNIALATDKGLRGTNEDALVLDTEHDAFAVVDGIGGYDKGEVAARIVAEAIQEDFSKPEADPVDLQERASKQMSAEGIREGGAAYLACRVERNGKELFMYQAGDAGLIIVDSKGKITFSSEPTSLADAPRANISGKTDITKGIPIKNYDTIVVATDGLWDNVHPDDVARIVVDGKVEDVLPQLAALAKKGMTTYDERLGHGNPDNITILLYQIVPVPLRGK